MKSREQRVFAVVIITFFVLFILSIFVFSSKLEKVVIAQDTSSSPNPSPTPKFDQDAAIAKIREQIKGKENMPAGEVFKNIKQFKQVPAGRLLAIMKFGYSRSLGVDCTHCHTPDKWADESKPQKQIARDMREMSAKINGELLKNMESLGGRQAIVNCTTCHRGQIKPALNLPNPKPKKETKSE